MEYIEFTRVRQFYNFLTNQNGGKMEKRREGSVVFRDWLGYFIQPDDDAYAVVSFPDFDHHLLPEGLSMGDRVGFILDEDRCTAREFLRLN